MAGTLKVSKNIWAATSLLLRGFSGASVSKTGCCEGPSEEIQTRTETIDSHLFAQCTQFFCIDPAPYAFHIIPVCYNAMLHRILDLEEAAEFLCFTTDEDVSFEGTRHDTNVFWAADTADNMGKISGALAIWEEDGRTALTVETHKDGKKHLG